MEEVGQNTLMCQAVVDTVCIQSGAAEIKAEPSAVMEVDINSLAGGPLFNATGCSFSEASTLVPIDVSTVQPLQIIQTQTGTILTTGTIENMVVSMSSEVCEPIAAHQLYGKVWQVIPSVPEDQEEPPGVTVYPSGVIEQGESEESQQSDNQQPEQDASVDNDSLVAILTRPPLKPLPPDTPQWARCLKDCELIGDSYRGWVPSEADLDLLLMHHKHQTSTCWGTRQSTGSHRNSLRLMWKSQYVPYDGIPFINAGSRAIVMECEYGPRRKGGNAWKKASQNLPEGDFKQTCPARIYIKKVKKFPKFQVNLGLDKKSLRASMDKAFLELKNAGFDGHGEDRWYVQLPTESAHEFHDGSPTGRWPQSKKLSKPKVITEAPAEDEKQLTVLSNKKLSRIHPRLITKIRDLVSHGESSVFAIRRRLRKFVEREMFTSNGEVPERHNLCYFPTIHDIQNHVFEALKDLRTGSLPLLVPSVDIEVPNREVSKSSFLQQASDGSSSQETWEKSQPAESGESSQQIQTITVTLTRCNEPGQAPLISKIEFLFTDGTTKVASTMTQETFSLLSRLHPSIFPPGSLIQIPELPDGLPVVPAPPALTDAVTMNNTSDSADSLVNTDVNENVAQRLDNDPMQVLNTESMTFYSVGMNQHGQA